MMDKKEHVILLNFLKSGLSTRQLDRLLGYDASRGWVSWEILRKYKLQNSDKGKLFVYSPIQCNKLIVCLVKKKKRGVINEIIKKNPSNILEKYKNTFVIADSERSFYTIMSGETRNIIQGFFNPKKKLIGKCQFRGCTETRQIDTVHFDNNRRNIFIKCAKKNKISFKNDLYKFDVYKTMLCFLINHSKPKSVCFLCKKHHNDFHRFEKLSKNKLNEFKRKIIF